MKKALLLLATFVTSIVGVTAPASAGHGGTHYRIVHTGDSISVESFSPATQCVNGGQQWVIGTEEWRNLECGRDAYTAGLNGWASTSSIWPLIRDRSEPGGFIIIQDNGANSTESNWRTLMELIRDETPSDRTLIIVLPGYRSDINPTLAATLAVRARIMREVFATHPSVVFIHFDQYLKRNPANFPDGQHPNTTAETWLRDEINRWTA